MNLNLPWIRCPQCGSLWCGPVACRFSGLQHQEVAKVTAAAIEAAREDQREDPCATRGT